MIEAEAQSRGAGLSAEPGFHASAAATERGRVSVKQEWRTTGKKNPARQPGIISKWGGGIATRLILAPDVSIVQMVGVENPARWPGCDWF